MLTAVKHNDGTNSSPGLNAGVVVWWCCCCLFFPSSRVGLAAAEWRDGSTEARFRECRLDTSFDEQG